MSLRRGLALQSAGRRLLHVRVLEDDDGASPPRSMDMRLTVAGVSAKSSLPTAVDLVRLILRTVLFDVRYPSMILASRGRVHPAGWRGPRLLAGNQSKTASERGGAEHHRATQGQGALDLRAILEMEKFQGAMSRTQRLRTAPVGPPGEGGGGIYFKNLMRRSIGFAADRVSV